MPVLVHRSARRATSGVLALLIAGAALVAGTGPAAAEPPEDLRTQVTDTAGVLTDAGEQRVAAALDALEESTPYQLFVVYVDSFDGMSNEAWAERTAELSGLGRDDILLAVAVQDRRYQVSVADEIALTDEQLARVEQQDIEPALGDDDWAGAAVAAAEGYEREVNPPAGTGGRIGIALLVGALLAGAGWSVWAVLRRRRDVARAAAALDALDDRSALALVAADEAVAAAAQDLGFAEAQLGTQAVAPAAAAVAEARGLLAEAFRSRQALDDDEPDTDARRSSLAYAVLDGCSRVDQVLAAQREALGALRDAQEQVPTDLAAVRTAAAEAAVRATTAGTTWTATRQRYAPTAMADVPDTVAAAGAAAAEAIEQADAGTALLGTDPAEAARRLGEARAALARAAAILDDLDRRSEALTTAPETIVTLVTQIDADLVDADRLGTDLAPVQQAAATARRAQERARGDEATGDPLAALTTLREAEQALDRVLDPLREDETARAHAVERIPQVLATVQMWIAQADHAIDRDRLSIGATTRTRLAEAHRLRVQGELAASTDPVASLRDLRAAADRAEEAVRSAAADVSAARRRAAAALADDDDGPTFSSGSTGWGRGSSVRWSSGGSSRGRSSSRSSSGSRGASSRSSGGRRGGGGRF